MSEMSPLQTELVDAIRSYVATSPLNRLRDVDGSPIWEEPLVGFADGDDPLFERYKEVVAPEHWTPRQALAELAGGPRDPSAFPHVGMVSWILPTAALTRLSNREMSDGPSLRWNYSRFQGEDFNDSLRRYVVNWFKDRGWLAVAPFTHPNFRRTQGPFGIASTWSERHMAHAAGLGTFGLSDGLITAKGIAHRCGSAVANVSWPATPRPYSDHREYCLYAQDGSCGVCIERCPAGAIGTSGHDKERCGHYLRVGLASWLERPGYGGEYVACGLCQTGVPCESGIPARTKQSPDAEKEGQPDAARD